MSTTETDPQLPAEADPCEQCGSAMGGGRFCSECGHPVAGSGASGDAINGYASLNGAPTSEAPTQVARVSEASPVTQTAADPDEATRIHRSAVPPASPAPAGSAPRNRTPLIAGIAAAVALLVLVGVAAVVLTSKDNGSADTASRQKLAAVFGPVLGANNDVSRELARIHGANPTDARAAVSRAQQATTAATGALSTLSVPAGSQQLLRDGSQVLDRQTAYLAAVGAVLSNQSSASRSQLETLSSNLASAFSAAGPTIAGTSPTVSGADVLTAWAQRTARVLKKRARQKAARRRARAAQTGSSTAATAAVTTNPYANGRSCGGGVYAGPNTSCDFAFNVRSAYLEAPGLTASVTAFSPATGQTYTMDCAPSGSGTTCSGANDASVTF
jgi:hypothetical protein